jgi:hypothetical protein
MISGYVPKMGLFE